MVEFLHDLRTVLEIPDGGPTGDDIRVAVVDTGADIEHRDIKHCKIDSRSFNVIAEGTNIGDAHGHGTSMTGILAGLGERFRGIAPRVDLTLLKADRGGEFSDIGVIAALGRVRNEPPHVVLISSHENPERTDEPESPPWHWSADSRLERVLNDLTERGALVIVPAGNLGPREGTVARPGGCKAVLTIGAVSRSGHLLRQSGRGPYRVNGHLPADTVQQWGGEEVEERSKPDAFAVGSELWTPQCSALRIQTAPLPKHPLSDNGNYRQFEGTSAAVAVVGGLAALAAETVRARLDTFGGQRGRVLKAIITTASSENGSSGILRWESLKPVCERFLNHAASRKVILSLAGIA
jgi:subtilisin family serine protease